MRWKQTEAYIKASKPLPLRTLQCDRGKDVAKDGDSVVLNGH